MSRPRSGSDDGTRLTAVLVIRVDTIIAMHRGPNANEGVSITGHVCPQSNTA